MLHASGYQERSQEQDLDEKADSASKYYVVIPALQPLKQQKEGLLQAFYKGWVVVLDERDSRRGLERLLNALLTGVDLNNQPDKNPELQPRFRLLSTQNGFRLGGGRHAASNAVDRRRITITLPPYTQDELNQLFPEKKPLIQDYLQARQQAMAFPAQYELPTFRALQNAAVVTVAVFGIGLISYGIRKGPLGGSDFKRNESRKSEPMLSNPLNSKLLRHTSIEKERIAHAAYNNGSYNFHFQKLSNNPNELG